MTLGDTAMRELGAGLPVPTFDDPAFSSPPPLDRADRQLVLGHWSPNFDRSGFTMDLNVVFPIDRLEELAAAGVIGDVAPRHLAFAGNQPDDVATIRMDSGPAAAQELLADGVDVVLLTPV